ncbi:MAG: CYTH and CHAD domain-containing protein [Acetobacteraceae bacterium]
MAGPEEIEIKLRLPARASAALLRHHALTPPRASLPQTHAEVTTYFDSRSGQLSEAGVSLRVRRAGDGKLTQTLKLGQIAEGIAARRGEWEWPVTTDSPDLGLLAGIEAAPIAALDGALIPICSTEIDRTVWQIRGEDGALIEAVIDRGRIRASRRAVAVSELELELKSGPPGALYRLALELAASVPLAIEPASKAERGARLGGQAGRGAVTHGAVALSPGMNAAEAFRCILGTAIGHMRVNLAPAARGQPEGVHQLRIATRRLRAAIALFRPLLAPPAAGRFNAALRRSGRIFGAARDWDVFVTQTLPAAEAEDGIAADWLRLLAEAAAPSRAAAHVAVARELAAPGFTLLLLGLSVWAEDGVDDPVGLGEPALARSVKDTVPALLDRLLRRTARRARHIGEAGPGELHALRKAMKTLRYGVEFTAPLHRPKAVKGLLKPCKHLQEKLGTVNDAASTPDLAASLATEDRPDLAPALGALGVWAERRGAAARAGLPKAWHALRDADPFWR